MKVTKPLFIDEIMSGIQFTLAFYLLCWWVAPDGVSRTMTDRLTADGGSSDPLAVLHFTSGVVSHYFTGLGLSPFVAIFSICAIGLVRFGRDLLAIRSQGPQDPA